MPHIKIALLVYVFIYYGVLLVLRSWLLYKNTGINPIKNLSKKGMAGFIENVFLVCFILVSVIAFNYVWLENNYQYLEPIAWLENDVLGLIGIILGFSGLLIALVAQLQMGNSWRLGLNEQEKTALITKGMYQFSRNPIYLGLMISYLGFFLMAPNALSFGFLTVSYVAMEVKIRLEETYLEENHSFVYSSYRKKVRRWI